jgi:hypothetical protein
MTFNFSKVSEERLSTVDEKLQKVVRRALKESKVDFSVVRGKSTAEEQHEIFLKGYSECDGYKCKSDHQFGIAIDLVPYVKEKGGTLWKLEGNEKEWLELNRAMVRASRLEGVCLELGLGYNIGNGYDQGHFVYRGDL